MAKNAKFNEMLQAAAEMIRNAGKKTAGGDTVLAHITPAEAARLKAEGGSGRKDPVTGLPHFDAGGKRGDVHAGNASAGYGGGYNDREDSDDEEAKPKAASGMNQREAQLKSFGTDDNLEQRKAQAADPSMTDQETRIAIGPSTKKSKAAGFIVGELTGPFAGWVAEKAARLKKETQLTNKTQPGASNYADPERIEREQEGGREVGTKSAMAGKATDTEKLKETAAAPTFADFVAAARRRKGYQSTILGVKVPAGTPQGKRLLGS